LEKTPMRLPHIRKLLLVHEKNELGHRENNRFA
jgi:hypothetical protein